LVLYLDGTDFYQYKFDTNFNLIDRKYEKFDIINKKRKGGSSSNRYANIAKESRQNEVTEVVELVCANFDDKIKNIYVCGI
jgi:peptide subunit release factor 1 (eRF1)